MAKKKKSIGFSTDLFLHIFFLNGNADKISWFLYLPSLSTHFKSKILMLVFFRFFDENRVDINLFIFGNILSILNVMNIFVILKELTEQIHQSEQ